MLVILTATSLDINTVAAGGGSRLFWQNNMLVVGPEVRFFDLALSITS
jgi:5-oxoprolinase (ATP-hydrolysing)